MPTVFKKPINNLTTLLGADYAPGSGTMTVRAGDGARFGSVSAGSPIRVSVVAANLVNDIGQVAPPSSISIYTVTGINGDTLTGVAVSEGTSDQAFSAGDYLAVVPTAATFADIQAAINALEAKGDSAQVAQNTADIASNTADIATNTAGLASHVADHANPHAVTASQVGASVAQWNASAIQGKAVTATAPSGGQGLVYNATSGKWEPGAVGDPDAVITTGSYSDPAWLTSLSGAKVSGDIAGNAASITGPIATAQVTGLDAALAAKANLSGAAFTGASSVTVTSSTAGFAVTQTYQLPANSSGLISDRISATWNLSNGGSGNYTLSDSRLAELALNLIRNGAALPSGSNIDVLRLSLTGSPNLDGITSAVDHIECRTGGTAVFRVLQDGTLAFGSGGGLIGEVSWGGSPRRLKAVNNSFPLELYANGLPVNVLPSGPTITPISVQGASGQTAPLAKLQGISSTSTARDVAYVDGGFIVSTDASFTGYLDLDTNDATGRRKGIRIQSDGSKARVSVSVPNSAPTDANIPTGQVSFYLDESTNTLKFRVKYSDGATLKTGSVSLA